MIRQTEVADATRSTLLRGPDGQSVQFCSLGDVLVTDRSKRRRRAVQEECSSGRMPIILMSMPPKMAHFAVSDLSFIMRKGETRSRESLAAVSP